MYSRQIGTKPINSSGTAYLLMYLVINTAYKVINHLNSYFMYEMNTNMNKNTTVQEY